MNYPARIEVPARVTSGFTAQELAAMIERGAFADMRVELLGGEIRKMAPAYGDHGRANGELYAELRQAYQGYSVWLAVDLAVRIDDDIVLAADVAVAKSDTPKNRLVDGCELVLVVEIAVSTLGRDLGDKALAYASAQVEHYWVVDPIAAVVHVFAQPISGSYAERSLVRFGEALLVPGIDTTITIG